MARQVITLAEGLSVSVTAGGSSTYSLPVTDISDFDSLLLVITSTTGVPYVYPGSFTVTPSLNYVDPVDGALLVNSGSAPVGVTLSSNWSAGFVPGSTAPYGEAFLASGLAGGLLAVTLDVTCANAQSDTLDVSIIGQVSA